MDIISVDITTKAIPESEDHYW